MSLSRAQILESTPNLKSAEVDASELVPGETIRVKELTARERWVWGRMSEKAAKDSSQPDPLSFMVTMAAVDADGSKLFSAQDVDRLQELPGGFIGRVTSKIMDLSGLSNNADDDLADAVGNSEQTPSSDTESSLGEASVEPSTS